jgi:flagellin-specific chaperone FliS
MTDKNKRVNLRLSENDYANLEQKAEALNLSIPEYLRRLIKKQKIVQPYISHQDAREIITELKSLSNLQSREITSRLDKIYQDITDRKT